MADVIYVPVPKMDVLMEDFSNIQTLIQSIADDRNELIAARNTWEVFFTGYDDDPREIPDIPEVVNWIEQSVEAGIPWFYFMKSDQSSMGLSIFMICCGADFDPEHPGRYYFDRERILLFIHKNLKNLENFVEKYNIPNSVSCAATDAVMGFMQDVLGGLLDQEQAAETIDRDKQRKEALERLFTLEKLFNLNPNVRNYFKEGRLYYSYITGGGYIGSIDTINYDKRYAAIVSSFEAQTSYMVYHVIECGDTIALLFVSDDYSHWLEERPTSAGVMAQVVNVESYENECGYINIDSFQGALYRRSNQIFSSLPEKNNPGSVLSDVESEIVERLEILKNTGVMTDLDMTNIFMQEGEICCSLLQSVLGTPVGVVNRLSEQPAYKKLLQLLSQQVSQQFYFLMGSTGNELAFLYVSGDPKKWENEKLALEEGKAYAFVVDPEEMTASVRQIVFQMVNGGPIVVSL